MKKNENNKNMTLWEYKLLPAYRNLEEDMLNEFGSEGWELCSSGCGPKIMKRPKTGTRLLNESDKHEG